MFVYTGMYVGICGLVYLVDNVISTRNKLCRGCDEYARYETLHRKHIVMIRLYIVLVEFINKHRTIGYMYYFSGYFPQD